MSSRSNTLFVQSADPGPSTATFVLSVLVHGLAAVLIWFSFVYKPPFVRITHDHLTVREIDLRTPDEEKRETAAHIDYPGAAAAAKQAANNGSQQHVPVLRQKVDAPQGPQTLLQPDLVNSTTLAQKIPVPQVMIWSPSKTIVKKVEPPQPQKPTSADVKPIVKAPNQEINLSDVNISASIQPAPKQSLFKPSTTTPVAVHAPQQPPAPPATASQPAAQPTPAAILSLSDMRMKQGTVMVPAVNESVSSNSPGALAPGAQTPASQANGAASAAPAGNKGAGQNSPNAGKSSNNAGQGSTNVASNSSAPGTAGQPNAANSLTGSGSSTSADAPVEPQSVHIALPKDGHFGAVVIGQSLEEKFPEASGVWNGRVAYTAYLHVGLAKSWILQYSLPLSTDPSGGGTLASLEAPWPYDMVRPTIAPGSIDADALMIHGFVNQSGRFETLSVVFPQPFAATQFVLAALEQWQFRPARRDGQSAKVEVLIIIPDELD